VTLFGLFLTPVFYVLIQLAAQRLRRGRGVPALAPAPGE
jgi:hypothetical protein